MLDVADPRAMLVLRDLMLFGPIGLLWGVGLWLTLQSGAGGRGLRGGRLRRLASTAGMLGVRLAAWMAGLVLLMEAVGFRALPR